ncbi:uncharacterized protein LOC122995084 isoform X2 [Thunnus albacares]|uniref:uncharacterized protein LOC122995084 isoform X2 n=1 Tax=Thunnus albacares TaxID=8236 RepID=UPI001CF6E2D5|nr:uncharacterized protein LOC122995084 isoform X2 [Thunnus albacares]
MQDSTVHLATIAMNSFWSLAECGWQLSSYFLDSYHTAKRSEINQLAVSGKFTGQSLTATKKTSYDCKCWSTKCSFSEPAGAQQCLGVLGQPLLFHLPNTKNREIKLIKDNKYIILKIAKNQTVTSHIEYVNQPEFFTNGTFKLGNAMKRHSGDYQVEEFGLNGTLLKQLSVHLEIRAPVSEPVVSQMCLSPEQMKVSCFSEGDEVELILSLDGYVLMHTRVHSQSPSCMTANMHSQAGSVTTPQDKAGASNVSISLHGQLMGNLTCHVWNSFSKHEAVIHLTGCKASNSDFLVGTVAMIAGAVIVLLVLLDPCLGIYQLHKKTQPTAIKEDFYTTLR